MKIKSIAKNTSYFTLALVLQKVITFTYFTILARSLPPDSLGKYYLAISITTLFAIFIDIGLNNLLTREVARQSGGQAKEEGRAQKMLSTVLAVKLPLAGLAWFLVFAMVNLLDYPEITRQLAYLSTIPMILDSFTTTFFAVLRGKHNLKYESIASPAYMLVAMVTGVILLQRGYGLLWIMGALVLASIFYFLYSMLSLALNYKIYPWPRWNWELIKPFLLLTVPFGLYGILQRAFTYLDTVLLSVLANDWHVGLYQIAFKIIFALQFLPMAFIASLYPAFSRYWKEEGRGSATNAYALRTAPAGSGPDPVRFDERSGFEAQRRSANADTGRFHLSQLVITFERAMNYLVIISLPISVGVIVLADKIISLFKPEYAEAVLPLQIIMSALLFLFLNFPVGSLLNACDRQKQNTANMAIALTVSVALNLVLIPLYQSTGAAATVLLANAVMFALGLRLVPRIIQVRWKKIIIPFLKSLFSVIIMGILVYYLKYNVNIILLIPAGGLVYFIMLFISGAVRKEDLGSIYKSFSRK